MMRNSLVFETFAVFRVAVLILLMSCASCGSDKKLFLKQDLNELKKEFNVCSHFFKISPITGDFEINSGGIGKTYVYKFSKILHVMGDINSDGNVMSCIIMKECYGDDMSSTELSFISYVQSFALAVDRKDSEKCFDFISSAIITPNKDIYRNNIKYRFYYIDNNIKVFVISAIKDGKL